MEGERNPAYGKKWYHNDEGEMILIGESDCIPEGFVRGTGRYPCEGRTMLISPLGERKYVINDCVEQFRLEGWKTTTETKKPKSSRKQTPNNKKEVDSVCNADNALSKVDKYKNTMKNKTQEEKELIRLHRSESHKGKKHTEEHKNRIGKGVRKFYEDHPERLKPPKTKGKFHLTDEQKQKVSISMVGRKHITNGIQNKFVFSQDVDKYLSIGWKLGQTSKDKMQENQS